MQRTRKSWSWGTPRLSLLILLCAYACVGCEEDSGTACWDDFECESGSCTLGTCDSTFGTLLRLFDGHHHSRDSVEPAPAPSSYDDEPDHPSASCASHRADESCWTDLDCMATIHCAPVCDDDDGHDDDDAGVSCPSLCADRAVCQPGCALTAFCTER